VKEGERQHEQLVKAGRLWLLNSRRCRVVIAEMHVSVMEQPDVLGWNNLGSMLIECKASRADFFVDGKKPHRREGCGVGQQRWYLTPPGLVRPDEVTGGWGLLERRPSEHTRGYYIKEVLPAPCRRLTTSMLTDERAMLVSAAWRALEAMRLTRPLAIGDAG